jgi:hypothetical protein
MNYQRTTIVTCFSRLFIRISLTFIEIHDKLYTKLSYMRTNYCELWQHGHKMNYMRTNYCELWQPGHKMNYMRTNYCELWQPGHKMNYMRTNYCEVWQPGHKMNCMRTNYCTIKYNIKIQQNTTVGTFPKSNTKSIMLKR